MSDYESGRSCRKTSLPEKILRPSYSPSLSRLVADFNLLRGQTPPSDDEDLALYSQALHKLRTRMSNRLLPLPEDFSTEGYKTRDITRNVSTINPKGITQRI